MGNNEMTSISKPAILWGNPMASPFRTRTFITAWWWLEHEWIMTVPFSWECHHPADELTFTPSFFRGVGQPPSREFIVKHPNGNNGGSFHSFLWTFTRIYRTLKIWRWTKTGKIRRCLKFQIRAQFSQRRSRCRSSRHRNPGPGCDVEPPSVCHRKKGSSQNGSRSLSIDASRSGVGKERGDLEVVDPLSRDLLYLFLL